MALQCLLGHGQPALAPDLPRRPEPRPPRGSRLRAVALRRGDQHPAGRAAQHVLGHRPDLGRARAADRRRGSRRRGSASAARRPSRSSRPRGRAPPRRSRRRSMRARTTDGCTSTVSYSSPTCLRPLERRVRRLGALGRRRRVERHGQRQVDDVDHLEPRRGLARAGRRRRRAARPCRRCRRRACVPKTGTRMSPYSSSADVLDQRLRRDLDPLASASSPRPPCGRSRRRRARRSSSRRRPSARCRGRRSR